MLPWAEADGGGRGGGAVVVTEGVIEGVAEEDGPLPHSGCLVQLSYAMLWRGEGVEGVAGVEVEVGCGALVVPMEEWVVRMQAGQTCTGRLQLGPSPCFLLRGGHGAQEVEVRVSLLSCTFPREEQLESALFIPPLAKQRCQVAIDLIATAGAQSVVHSLHTSNNCSRLEARGSILRGEVRGVLCAD